MEYHVVINNNSAGMYLLNLKSATIPDLKTNLISLRGKC